MTMAAYIDLNPIRAAMVGKPEDYRWSGYAEAMAGRRTARGALAAVVETHQRSPQTHESALATYSHLLYGEGQAMKAGQTASADAKA